MSSLGNFGLDLFPRSSLLSCVRSRFGGERNEELVNGTELENYMHGYLVCDHESGYQLTPGQVSPGNNDAQRLWDTSCPALVDSAKSSWSC